MLTSEIESRLHPFVGGILRDLECTPIAINGTMDHPHVLVRYPSKRSHSDMLMHLKGRSSTWLNESFPTLRTFRWQEGYGGFTVSKTIAPNVESYILNQKQHHKKMGFKEEFLGTLRRAEIDFDPEEVFK